MVGAAGKTINIDGNEIRDINIYSSDSNTMINGTSGNDTLNIRGTNVTVDGGAGDDYFNSSIKYSILKGNSGNDLMEFAAENSVIDGGDGDDNISANMTATVDATTYENFRNTLIGGAGNDYITNFGEYASIDGGTGNDYIYSGADYATIIGGKGNDMVSVDFSANNNLFKYNAGDGNDTIIGFDSNDTLDIVGAEFSTTKSGSDMLISVKDSGTITLKNTSSLTVDGLTWRIIGTTAEYGTLSNTLITLKGLKNGTKESDLSLSGNVVTLKPSALGTSNISVTGNYTLALSGVSEPSTTSAHWNISNGTAKYQSASSKAGYTLAGDKKSVTYTAAVAEKNLATVTGLKSTASTSDLLLSGNVITLKASALDNKNVSVTGNYTLALSGVSEPSTIPAGWTVSGTTATYKTKKITAGYTLSSNKRSISYTKASGGATKITLNGLKSGTKASYLTLKNNVVTISKNAIGTGKITAKGDGYTFVLGSSCKLTYAGSNATLKSSTEKDSIYGGSKADTIYGGSGNDSILGNSGNDKLFGDAGNDTIVGGKGNDTLTGGKGSDIFIYANGDGNDTITDFSKSGTDTLRIGEDGKGNYSLNTIKNDVVVTISKGSVILVGAAKLSKLNIEGTKENDAVIVKGKGVTLTEDYDDETFELVGSEYKSIITLDASAVMSELKIVGNTRANKIIGSSQNDTIYGGTANDCLKGGKGSDVFVYNKGDGNDKILDYTDEDSINIKGDNVTGITTKGNNAVLNLASKNKISLIGGDYDVISYSDSNGEHSYFRNIESFVNFKSGGKIANLKSNYSKETFDSIDYSKYADKVVTINASAVDQSMNIVGNSKANYVKGTADSDTIDGSSGKDTIYGGNGNDKIYGGSGDDCLSGGEGTDTLIGGKDNDQLWGNGDGDIFVYNPGDGNDTIFDYDSSVDKIILTSGSVDNVTIDRSDNVVFKIGSGQIILSNAVNKTAQIVDSSGTVLKQYIPD